jgi:hypothetical protein
MRLRNSRLLLPLGLALGLAVGGCTTGPESLAFQNRVFYQYDSLGAGDPSAFEQRYPPLDRREQPPSPEFLGFEIFGGGVRLSRPRSWTLRTANNRPEERYVQYLSPYETIVSLYELVESPTELWRDVMRRYEETAKNAGAELVGMRMPMATWNAQGRSYFVKRRVKAQKGPFLNYSHEYLLRSDRRIVLVQIVHQSETLAELSPELLRFIETLQVF